MCYNEVATLAEDTFTAENHDMRFLKMVIARNLPFNLVDSDMSKDYVFYINSGVNPPNR